MCALRVPAMAATGFAAQSILRRVVPSFLSFRPTTHVVGDVFSGTNLILRTPLHPSVFGICSLPQAIKGDADILLKGVGDKNTIEDVKRIVELAKRASLRQEVLHTDFLTPPVLKESMLVLERLADLKTVALGGYPEAERCRLSVGHPEALTNDPDNVAALSISGNFSFQPCSHGDFLGAILGTGIARNKLGDILLQGEKGAHVLVVPELSDFLVSALDKVGNVSVSCKKIPLLALEYEPPRTKSSKSIEASLRLDAVASAGFKVSRTKMASLISNGDVRVNWSTVTKSNTTIKTGDMISVSGEGRLKIGEISSTRKGKFAVELIRYL
ncbi:putative RNA-binding protein YlmH isoform X2 [Solanum tuberosum]|nr:PREDICTED: putative RNA-binding protein YlmH isoform X2 [Solanum tuberosum]